MKSNSLIDIIAPSSPPKNNQWKQGVKILQSWGLKTRFSSLALSPSLFHAHSNQKRAFFLNQAFSSEDSSMIWMLRGGYGFQKLIPSFIKRYSKTAKKKLFIGYSDGTALHLYLNHQNQKTLHAPTVSELADLKKIEFDSLKKILLKKKKEITFKNLKFFKPAQLKKFGALSFQSQEVSLTKAGKFKSSPYKKTLKGKIIGGNLSLLSSNLGLPWLSSFKSGFLFLEDVNEEAYKLDRMLHHLFYSGALKSIKAILFGNFNPLNKKTFLKVLNSFSQVCSIPLIYDLPCGHRDRYSLPLNTSAELSIQGSKLDLKVKTF